MLGILTYGVYALVVDGRFSIAPAILGHVCAVLNGVIVVAVPTVWLCGEDQLARFGLLQGGQILLGVIFAPSKSTASYSVCYAIAFAASTAIGGLQTLTPLFAFQQAFQAALGILLPTFVEARETAKIQKCTVDLDAHSDRICCHVSPCIALAWLSESAYW